ncbi:PA14 domain-containing protein [Pseudodonghicola xiamenensis]|uniref:PA14 domain-containing protein n=1 Tax=Pseudodonghicola xiamenensis TaxID=337702 RepID=A0A8J3MGD4_9RHOB|nr:PA14 domain-containing protein [Pseudodonghicola xiamenensis]GHH00235.1 hypothetical protein GCM10010961_36760 [Pseudodonghicola xiamenensis]
MKIASVAALAAWGLGAAGAVAAPLKLTPAEPQPTGLKAGLAVKYAYLGPPPQKIQSMSMAMQMLNSAKPGQPLRGLDYRDTDEGDPVLTHKYPYNVAADITGFIRFDAPGVYEIETWSNDGINAQIGGALVGDFDGRQGCEANQRVEVQVPKAGWYPLKFAYFQKYGSSCLMMKWGKSGQKLKWVPNEVLGWK